MSLIQITPGVAVYQTNEYNILFGCPPEVIKHLMLKGVKPARVIVLPDTTYRFDVLQNCTEFPLYSFLFVEGGLGRGEKLTIVGSARHLKANRELLRLTLLGPTQAQYEALGPNPWFDELYREARALSVKGSDGQELGIDELVNFVPFRKGIARLPDGTEIFHTGQDRFRVADQTVDIAFNEPQDPPYDLRSDFTATVPTQFGVTVLGGASGFISDKPCSGLVLHYNSENMLIDCVPYLGQALTARGMSPTEISAIFLTHIHDDHCNIFPLLRLPNKVRFISTKEIFWMAMMKLSLQTLLPLEDLSAMFDFVEVKPYETKEFFGLSIEPHYTVHSIPTIGAAFRMQEGAQTRSIAFIGDNKSFDDIEQMVQQGAVRKEKFDALKDRYSDDFDILFADGGMGILHGNPRDALGSRAHRIVFMHLEKLPPEFDATFSHAIAGKRYEVIPGSRDSYLIRTMQILSDSFRGISHEWTTALMNNFRIVTFNSGDVIFKQNEASKGLIYIILTGRCSVMYHDGKTLSEKASKDAGDFVGEMAVLDENKVRSASIVASTPVTLCAINEKLFHEFLIGENRTDEMRQLWRIRSEIEQFAPFSEFADNVKDRIARSSIRRRVTAGDVIVEQGRSDGEFFIALSGEYSVQHNGIEVKVLHGGAMFGEYGSLDESVRNATVRAITGGEILELPRGEFKRIIESVPVLRFSLREMMLQRSRELRRIDLLRARSASK